jgi:hypothetical protein
MELGGRADSGTTQKYESIWIRGSEKAETPPHPSGCVLRGFAMAAAEEGSGGDQIPANDSSAADSMLTNPA